MGRPAIVLDDLRAKRIVDAVRAGLSRRGVAGRTGISEALLYDWLARGRDGESPFAELLERVKAAEAEVEQQRLVVIEEAALKSWQAAAWLLERTQPNQYARRDAVDETVTGPVTQQGDDLDAARAVVRALESKRFA